MEIVQKISYISVAIKMVVGSYDGHKYTIKTGIILAYTFYV